jgi:hypothetical protein
MAAATGILTRLLNGASIIRLAMLGAVGAILNRVLATPHTLLSSPSRLLVLLQKVSDLIKSFGTAEKPLTSFIWQIPCNKLHWFTKRLWHVWFAFLTCVINYNIIMFSAARFLRCALAILLQYILKELVCYSADTSLLSSIHPPSFPLASSG